MQKANKELLEAHERRVIDNAAYFAVLKIIPRRLRDRTEHKTLSAAVKDARGWHDPHGRPALLYAVDSQGRFVHINESAWDEELKRRSKRA